MVHFEYRVNIYPAIPEETGSREYSLQKYMLIFEDENPYLDCSVIENIVKDFCGKHHISGYVKYEYINTAEYSGSFFYDEDECQIAEHEIFIGEKTAEPVYDDICDIAF